MGPHTSGEERGFAERRALYVVAATFFLLAAYIAFEAISALANREGPESSTVGLVLAVFFWLAFWLYAPVEERHLERAFGERYRRYRVSVPRFFGLPRSG